MRNTPVRGQGHLISYAINEATRIEHGTMVALDAEGYLVPAADTAGLQRVVGIADESVDNTTGADGDKSCRVRSGIEARLVGIGLTRADIGTVLFVSDEETVEAGAGTTNSIPAGVLTEFHTPTDTFIWIPVGGIHDPLVVV